MSTIQSLLKKKPMKALIVFLATLCLTACITIKEVKKEEVKPKIEPTDNVTESTKVSTWTSEKKEYWTSMTFAQLGSMPQVRVRFSPWHLFKISKCIIGEHEKLHPDIIWWEKNIGYSQQNLNPIYARQIYDITYKCSWIQQKLQEKEMMEKTKTPLELEDSI